MAEGPSTKAKVIYVTDHAVLRWIQRAHGLDMDAIRAKIREEVEPLACVVGDGKYPVTIGGDTLYAVVRDSTVTTVLEHKSKGEKLGLTL